MNKVEELINNILDGKEDNEFENIFQIIFNRMYLTDNIKSKIRWRSENDIVGKIYYKKKKIIIVCADTAIKGKIFIRKNNNIIEEYDI